jgi:hypothetical protein
MSHRWISTGEGPQDQCYGCGVVAPYTGDPITPDYGPLPTYCPGPTAAPTAAHHFLEGVDGIECAFCGYRITDLTDPTAVEWDCHPEE